MKRLLVLLLGMIAGWPSALTVIASVTPPLTPPHPLKAIAISDSQIQLTWPARFTNDGKFKIERSTDVEHFVPIAFIPATTNRFMDQGLLSATVYYYRVSCHTAAGDSAYSKVAHDRTRGPKGHLSLTAWGLPVGDPPAKLDDLVAVAAGLHHQVVLQKNGKVTAWGDVNATNGQVKFPKDLQHVAAITAGGYHSLALKENGTVVAWGANTNQQATPPPGLKNVTAIAAGAAHSLALKADGTVVGWGNNDYGQCTPPTNLDHVVAIATGGNHSLALKNDGTVIAWGQLLYRWPHIDYTNIIAISAGEYYDLLLKSDGTVATWAPWWGGWWGTVPPFDLTNVVAIAAGDNHNLALKADGTVVGWGYNQYGVASVPEGLSKAAFIAAGSHASFVLSALPAPPLQFMARATTTNQVTLSWVDNCNNEDNYVVERATTEEYWGHAPWTRIATLRANATNCIDTTASPGLTYWYWVHARNHQGDSAMVPTSMQALSMLPPGALNTPYASIGASNCVNLQWDNYVWLSGIPDGYEIQRAPNAAGSPGAWSDIGVARDLNTTTIYFTDTNVVPLQTYWYRVRASNVFGKSDYSLPATVTLLPPPAPDLLTVTAFADRLDLNWGADDSFGSGVDVFSIERAPDIAGAPGSWSAFTNMPIRAPYAWSYSCSDTGHGLDSTWWYRVRAHNWIGYGPYSTPANGTIILPAAPTWLTGWIGSSNQINLQWQQYPSDQNGFRIERAADSGGAPGTWTEIGILQLTNATEAVFTDKQVTALTTNWYRVRAFNQLGSSDYSTAISVATVPPPAPVLSVSTYRSQFTLNYSLPAYHFDTGNFDGYKIERAPDVGGSPGTWTQIAQTYEESFTDSGFALNTACWYRVRASNWIGDGAYSLAVSSTIIPPGTPESLIARIGTTNRINVEWADSHYDQDGFRVEHAPDAGGTPGSWTEIAVIFATNSYYGNFTDTNVVAGSTNWYRVRAFNEVGLSAYGGPVSMAAIPPPAPTYSGASVNRDQVDFYWDGDYNVYGKLTGFKIERAPDAAGNPGTWQEIGQTSSDENHFTDSGRPGNTTWWYRSRAYNWIGESDPGPTASATIRPPLAPNPVSGRISASNQVDLSWYTSSPDEDSFQLERAPDDGGAPGNWMEIAVIPATNSWWGNYTDTNLTGLTTNWYRVRSFNVVGSSDYSYPTPIPLLPPHAPYTLWASPIRDQVVVNWSANYGDYGYVEGFKIERAPDLDGSPGDWSQIGILTITNPYASDFAFVDSGRDLNTTWWYRVRAYNWTGDGDYSPLASATIIPPAAPEWVIGKIGSTNEVILSWYESQNDVDGFRIERASDEAGVPSVWTEIGIVAATNANYAEFTDTNATALSTNWYRVRAYNLFGNSGYAEPALVEVVPPPPPYYTYAQSYRDQINLSWFGDYGSYGTNSGFKIERAPDAGGEPGAWIQVSQVGKDINNYSDSNLLLNSTWWYRVRAYNWVGDGEPSVEASATILPPSAPDWIVGRIGSTNQLNLLWGDSNGDEDGFRLERAPDINGVPGTWVKIADIAPTSFTYTEFTDTNVTALTTNWYRIQAFNTLAASDYTVSTAIPIRPPPPPQLSVGVYRDQVNLSWYFNYNYDYGLVSGFQLERAPDVADAPGDWSQIGTVTVNGPYDSYFNYTDPARPVNTKFWYRVRAFNWVGEGDYSSPVSATTVPPATPNYMYGSLGSTNQINLTWYDYAQDEDGFQLEWAPDTNGIPGAWQMIADLPAPNSYGASYTDTNVTAYSTNWYRVRAYSVLGSSGYCDAISVKAMPPDAPTWINAYPYNIGRVSVYWSVTVAEGYELERTTNAAAGSEMWIGIARNINSGYWNTGYDDTNIVAGGSYIYRVKAFNWVGDSPWSPVAAVTIPAATSTFTGAAVRASTATPTLRITSLILTNQDVLITWDTMGGTTNVVQSTANLADGFADISSPLFISESGIGATNFLDSGAQTNASRRFYRIKRP